MFKGHQHVPAHRFGRRTALLGSLATLAACAPTAGLTPAPFRLDGENIGYMLFEAPIVPTTADYFQNDIDKMLALNAREIHIGISSPGGVISSGEQMIACMDRIHTESGVVFVTHNVGVVASAACYVFLAGQRRYSVPKGTFLFHEAGVQTNGVLTGQNLQEASVQLKLHEDSFLRLLKSRTRLTDGEALSFVRRTVILTTDEARRDGIIEATADFKVPPGTPAIIISIKPAASTRPGAPQD